MISCQDFYLDEPERYHIHGQLHACSFLDGSLAVLISFRLQGGQRKTGSNINGIRDQILPQTPTETII